MNNISVKKISSLYMIFLLVFTLSCFAKDITGSGTEKDPYLIFTLKGLEMIGNEGYPLSAHYELAADIDASITLEDTYSRYGWKPIDGFSGTFDGKGHKINNLHIDTIGVYKDKINYMGLFGEINGAEISNLELKNICIHGSGDYSYIGGVVAYNNGGELINISCQGYISGSDYTGGLVGFNKGKIKRSKYKGHVIGEKTAGLVAYNDGIIIQSYVLGRVEGIYSVGGLVCENYQSIEQSFFIGNIKGEGSVDTGRLAAWNDTYAAIIESYVLGVLEIVEPIEYNPYQEEHFHHDGGLMGGGLVGTNSWLRLVDEEGRFTGEKNLGQIDRSYYWEIGRENIGDGGSEITAPETYKSWDFNTVWRIDNSYPRFQWEYYEDFTDLDHKNSAEAYREFKGMLDKHQISMKIKEDNGQVSGTYYYNRIGKEIKIKGSIDINNNITMEESFDEEKTGQFTGKYYKDIIIGRWSSLDKSREYAFILYLK